MTATKRNSPQPLRLETDRLIVRSHVPDDAPKYHAWDSDPELVYLNEDESDGYEPVTLQYIEQYLREFARPDPRRGIIHFAIEKKDGGVFIGFGMIAEIEPQHRRCKLGITIGEKSEWGKGYAREALVQVIDYCFGALHINRIIAEIYCMNERSRRLFEGLGFKHEGTLRQSVWKEGRPLDDCLYALLREDWECRPPPATS